MNLTITDNVTNSSNIETIMIALQKSHQILETIFNEISQKILTLEKV